MAKEQTSVYHSLSVGVVVVMGKEQNVNLLDAESKKTKTTWKRSEEKREAERKKKGEASRREEAEGALVNLGLTGCQVAASFRPQSQWQE